jgi:plasmid maintenance system killer protein
MAIASIKHKGLKQLFQGDNRKGVAAEFADKIQRMLTALH